MTKTSMERSVASKDRLVFMAMAAGVEFKRVALDGDIWHVTPPPPHRVFYSGEQDKGAQHALYLMGVLDECDCGARGDGHKPTRGKLDG